MATEPCPPLLVEVVRDGVVESTHRGDLVVAGPDGVVVAALGSAALPVYGRSALKPFQAMATLSLASEHGVKLDTDGLAISCASHAATSEHQVEAARLLAEAGLEESALRCPPALPDDVPTLVDQGEPTPLAHNCSGKHAGFLLAHTAGGGDPTQYLERSQPLQELAREFIAACTGAALSGPGVDGCGAPAWLLPLAGIATGFARLAQAREGPARRVRGAMTARPDLVGGPVAVDTGLMLADPRIVAKRGAEAVLAAGWWGAGGPLGVAVKVADGGHRACGPVVAAVLRALGATVPDDLLEPPVLGGGRRHGSLRVTPQVRSLMNS